MPLPKITDRKFPQQSDSQLNQRFVDVERGLGENVPFAAGVCVIPGSTEPGSNTNWPAPGGRYTITLCRFLNGLRCGRWECTPDKRCLRVRRRPKGARHQPGAGIKCIRCVGKSSCKSYEEAHSYQVLPLHLTSLIEAHDL